MNEKKNPISEKSMLYIHKVVLIWMLMSLFIFFLGHKVNLDINAINFLSEQIWFVDDMSTASRFTEGIKLQWLFLTLSIPLVVIYLVYKIDDVKYGDMQLKVPITMALISVLPGIFIFIEKQGRLDVDQGYYGLFLNSILAASVMSFVMFYTVMLGIVISGLYIKSYLQKNRG